MNHNKKKKNESKRNKKDNHDYLWLEFLLEILFYFPRLIFLVFKGFFKIFGKIIEGIFDFFN